MINPQSNISDIELEAAEYVLGTVRGEARANIKQRLSKEPELRQWVNWWEQRFFSLSLHPKPLEPRKQVWKALSNRLKQHKTSTVPVASNARRFGSIPGYVTGALTGFALAGLIVIGTLFTSDTLRPPREAPTHYASFQSNGLLSHIVERYEDGHFDVIAVRPSTVTDEKVLELWLIETNSAPASLGLLPKSGRSRHTAPKQLKTANGSIILAVSVEPAGGSPTGLPTGPVVNTTKLVERAALNSFSF